MARSDDDSAPGSFKDTVGATGSLNEVRAADGG
jgi:hypothetical protein